MRSVTRSLMAHTKCTISALTLAPPSQLLTHNLTPDPKTPSVAVFRNEVATTNPSLQRRARLLSSEAHFSYVTPFPVPFPYDIEPPSPTDDVDGTEPASEASYVEKWLAAREPRVAQPPAAPNANLIKFTPEVRDNLGPVELLGVAETTLRDCVPHLDVGDAFAILGTPSLVTDDGEEITDGTESAVAARKDLMDVLSGRAVLMSDSFAPWAVRYSGHQFGTWAGQLGDGRATSILVTPHPTFPDSIFELQLKGSGRTPFSRSADGLAVTRSSIREYLCSEAMQALGIPTTRALALVSLPTVPVLREKVESACVLTRVAPSFLRIGSFEALSPPQNVFLFGGGQQAANWDALRTLGLWVAGSVLKLPEVVEAKEKPAPWGQALVLEVARRNARMVAGWQAYGFMHGVINTDNVSVLSLTIDYGPYAFMDLFDWYHICNHTDSEGRYAYRSQPTNILFAIRSLHAALAPLIGAELALGHAVPTGWAEGASAEDIAAWRTRGMDALKEELESVTLSETAVKYAELMRKRLALRRTEPTDEATVVRPLLDLMSTHKLDFHSTFRSLTAFRPGLAASDLDTFIDRIFSQSPDAGRVDPARAREELRAWLGVYARRIEREADEWTSGGDMDTQRAREARASNPRFVLRQWVLQEVIAEVEKDAVRGRRVLAKVLHMASNPFEAWGGEDAEEGAKLDGEEEEERRLCGIGASASGTGIHLCSLSSMPTRYAALPSSAQDAEDRELYDAFGGVDDDEPEPVTTTPTPAPLSDQAHHVPGAYNFERDYDCPPPGSPPRPSSLALPNNYGNSNGRLPTEPVIPPAPSTSFFRRAVGAILPTHYSRLPTSADSAHVGVVGGGIENDGVFANVMAKPQRARTVTDEDGQIFTVPEFQQKEAPPSYAAAQADSVPPYWETTVHAPGVDGDMMIEDLPSGSFWVFLVNLFISFFFQFVGFLLTFLLHTSHAAKYGSRAGLGLTLIQYGFYSRGGSDGVDETDSVGEWPGLAPSAVPDPTPSEEAPMPNDVVLGGVSSRDWLSFLLMTLGWFLLLSSFIGFWRVKRWERSIRSSTSAPITAEAIERDAEVRHNIETIFGYTFSSSDTDRRQPMRRDENGALVVIPTQELLEEARLARDLRAAGLL